MIQDPQCNDCGRLRPADPDRKGFYCDAFPDGVPDAILCNTHDHKTPYPGDNGLTFEPKDGKKDGGA